MRRFAETIETDYWGEYHAGRVNGDERTAYEVVDSRGVYHRVLFNHLEGWYAVNGQGEPVEDDEGPLRYALVGADLVHRILDEHMPNVVISQNTGRPAAVIEGWNIHRWEIKQPDGSYWWVQQVFFDPARPDDFTEINPILLVLDQVPDGDNQQIGWVVIRPDEEGGISDAWWTDEEAGHFEFFPTAIIALTGYAEIA